MVNFIEGLANILEPCHITQGMYMAYEYYCEWLNMPPTAK